MLILFLLSRYVPVNLTSPPLTICQSPLGSWQSKNWDPAVGSTAFDQFCKAINKPVRKSLCPTCSNIYCCTFKSQLTFSVLLLISPRWTQFHRRRCRRDYTRIRTPRQTGRRRRRFDGGHVYSQLWDLYQEQRRKQVSNEQYLGRGMFFPFEFYASTFPYCAILLSMCFSFLSALRPVCFSSHSTWFSIVSISLGCRSQENVLERDRLLIFGSL